jgi:hypothetical protein
MTKAVNGKPEVIAMLPPLAAGKQRLRIHKSTASSSRHVR